MLLETLPDYSRDDGFHLLDGVGGADVVPLYKLIDIPLQVLCHHLVLDAVVPAFRYGSERLHFVDTSLISHILRALSASPSRTALAIPVWAVASSV